MSHIANAVVVGGAGAVGSWLAELLAQGGVDTTVVDLPGTTGAAFPLVEADILTAGPELDAVLGHADAVLLAVPECVACAAVPVLAPVVKPGALIADTLSVKSAVAEAWARVDADVEAVSLNPMFAPSLAESGRPVAAVTLRDGPRAQALLEIIEDRGFPVVRMGADEHDTLTASLQALTHAAILGVGIALRQMGPDIEQLVRVAPPPFQALLALVARIAGGTPEVYWDIQHANPRASQAREALSAGMRRVNESLAQGESSFHALFAELNDFLGAAAPELRNQAQAMLTALPVSRHIRGKEAHDNSADPTQ